ncbi:MAG: VWA domain-containing protein [Burkholderiales bacterium]
MTDSSITFGALWPLWFLLAIPLFWWIGRRTRTNLARRHLAAVTVLRCLAVALAAVALSQPVWRTASNDLSVAFALDVSGSVTSGFVAEALDWIDRAQARLNGGDSRVVVFADRPSVVANAAEARAIAMGAGANPAVAINRDATDMERALDKALLSLSRDRVKRIVLLTDGNETTGNTRKVLPRLKAGGVRVFPVVARTRDTPDVWIDGIELPDDIRDGEPIEVSVRVFSPGETRADVRLARGDQTLGARNVMLNAGLNEVSFEARLRGTGTATLNAAVEVPADTVAENNRATRTAWVQPRPRVLYVEGQPESARFLRAALEAESIEVVVSGTSALPSAPAELNQYDAVILSDAPAKALQESQMLALEGYVRDAGGGFLFAGGENTFGEEGYTGSTVEKILPVEFKAQDRRDLALVIAIDRSYSMRGRKIEYAKEAARAALDMLEEQHRFGVVAFDSRSQIAVPMQDARAKRRAEDQISRIQTSGQTNIYPALVMVNELLEKETARTKHVILLSDGETKPADFPLLLERMRAAGIVVSTVTLGEGGDSDLMKQFAELGGGRHYLAAKAEEIPKIFAEETRKAVGDNLVEKPLRPVVKHPMAALQGVNFSGAPALTGHVATQPRDTADIVLATPDGAPLLVRWQYGLGKAVMFASDVKNRWAAEWLQWPGYGKMWAQLVRETMRRESRESLDFRVARIGDKAEISLGLLAADGGFRSDVSPKVRVTRAGQPAQDVALRQTGPGEYSAGVPQDPDSTTTFALLAEGGITAQAASRAGVRVLNAAFADEYRTLPPNVALLTAVSDETGGKLGATLDEMFATQGDRGQRSHPLWPWLAAFALLAFLLDILLRRAPFAWRWLGS